jgi:hypothetical protein
VSDRARLAVQIAEAQAQPLARVYADYFRALRAELIEEIIGAEDGERDAVAHKIQLLDQLSTETQRQR